MKRLVKDEVLRKERYPDSLLLAAALPMPGFSKPSTDDGNCVKLSVAILPPPGNPVADWLDCASDKTASASPASFDPVRWVGIHLAGIEFGKAMEAVLESWRDVAAWRGKDTDRDVLSVRHDTRSGQTTIAELACPAFPACTWCCH